MQAHQQQMKQLILEKKTGDFKDFSDFCERIQNAQVNKKCIESLIKAGAFDDLGQTRKTLIASYETIIDSISSSNKKSFEGQVSMFDMGENEKLKEIKEMKYQYIVLPEYNSKELLSMEKEMLGLYISGHPLENIRHQIEAKTNINTMLLRQLMQTDLENGENIELEQNQTKLDLKDGQNVTYAGIISSVKKKYTKNNKLMAFITVEDLYRTSRNYCI